MGEGQRGPRIRGDLGQSIQGEERSVPGLREEIAIAVHEQERPERCPVDQKPLELGELGIRREVKVRIGQVGRLEPGRERDERVAQWTKRGRQVVPADHALAVRSGRNPAP